MRSDPGRWRPPSLSFTLFSTFSFLLSIASLLPLAQCQLVNGQFFTAGLAISDAPFPASTFTAGGNMPIALDVSGNGKLQPSSATSTAIICLEIYLISSETQANITISSGPDLLSQEKGSTVKHVTYSVPSCIAPGNYNLTYYESYRLNSQNYFAITPIPVVINNPGSKDSDGCPDQSVPEPQPQLSNPSPDQAWLGGGYTSQALPKPTPPPGNSGQDPQGYKFKTVTLTETRLVTTTATFPVTYTISVPGGVSTVVSTVTQTITGVMAMGTGGRPTLIPINRGHSQFGRVGVGGLSALSVMVVSGLLLL